MQVTAVADEGGAKETGTLAFYENTVDQTTGTIKLKATFPEYASNPLARPVRPRYSSSGRKIECGIGTESGCPIRARRYVCLYCETRSESGCSQRHQRDSGSGKRP